MKMIRSWVLRLVERLIRPIFWLIFYFRRQKLIPLADDDIFHTSATVLAEKIRSKKVTSEQVVSAFISRCRQVNPIVNAITDQRYEQAMQDARNVDKFLQSEEMGDFDLAVRKPLLGIPITIKETCRVAGMKHTNCVKANVERRAQSNSPPVELLINAGAIPIAVTSTPPYCAWIETSNSIIGYTTNPYNTNKTTGGSSGGEAALLSSAASVIGLGTDAGGSIPLPCTFTGIYGHKPSKDNFTFLYVVLVDDLRYFKKTVNFSIQKLNFFEMIPCRPQLVKNISNSEVSEIFTVGPMCRYVEDLELLMNVISDGNFCSNSSSSVDMKSLKIYFLEELKNVPVKENIKQKIVCAAQFLQRMHHCEIKRFNVEQMEDVLYICKKSIYGTFGNFVKDHLKKFNEVNWLIRTCIRLHYWIFKPAHENTDICDEKKSALRERIQNRQTISGSANTSTFVVKGCPEGSVLGPLMGNLAYNHVLKQADEDGTKAVCYADDTGLTSVLSNDGVLLLPTYAESVFYKYQGYWKLYKCSYAKIVGILGLAATTVPTGLDANKMPTAIQIVGAPGQDRLCIAVAKSLDKYFGGWTPPYVRSQST